jgi:hypothetical protein
MGQYLAPRRDSATGESPVNFGKNGSIGRFHMVFLLSLTLG